MHRRGIGLLGGTFDPIHRGHVHLAKSVYDAIPLSEIRFVPVAYPLLRSPPHASEAMRLEMLNLVVETEAFFKLDDREIKRGGHSYTIETLTDIRTELPDMPLFLIIGWDQFLQFDQWKAWRDIPQLCHIVVTTREGIAGNLNSQIKDFLFQHKTDKVDDLQQLAHGKILLLAMKTLPISATLVREKIAKGENVHDLVPEKVGELIQRYGLYK